MKHTVLFYWIGLSTAAIVSFASCPLFRKIAIRFNIIDHPNTAVKTHTQPTPYLGGVGIALAFFSSVAALWFLAGFPAELLKPLQGICFGGFLILLLGLVDDTVSGGLSFKEKFLVQFAASAILLFYDIRLNFIQPRWFAFIITMIWVTGVMNAINIIDIMDGLAGSIAVIAALAFLFISLPTEQVYVNIVACALAGACIGFLPYNLSKKRKMFMGDTGSLFIGYMLACLSLGTQYSTVHNAAIFAPILILGVPLYDTFFVMLLRYRKGMNPFLGSKDHFALRLEKMGFSRQRVVLIAVGACLVLSVCAWLTTRIWFWIAVSVYAAVLTAAWFIGVWLAKVKVEN